MASIQSTAFWVNSEIKKKTSSVLTFIFKSVQQSSILTTFIRLIRISTEPTRCFDLGVHQSKNLQLFFKDCKRYIIYIFSSFLHDKKQKRTYAGMISSTDGTYAVPNKAKMIAKMPGQLKRPRTEKHTKTLKNIDIYV